MYTKKCKIIKNYNKFPTFLRRELELSLSGLTAGEQDPISHEAQSKWKKKKKPLY